MTGLVAAALAGGSALTGSGALLALGGADESRVGLSLPPDLVAEQVETFLGAVAGLPARARVTTTVEGVDGRLRFGLHAGPPDVGTLRAGLQGFAAGVRLTDIEPDADESVPRLRARLGWRGMYVLLRTDQRELAVAALLGVLRGVEGRERLRLLVRLRPMVRPKAPPYRSAESTGRRPLLERVFAPLVPLPPDQVAAIRRQYGGPLLSVRLEVEVWAASRRRAHQLLAQVVAVLRSRSGLRGRFSARSHRFALPGLGTMLAPSETAALIGWPLAGPDVPGLSYNRAPQRLPDEAIPRRGGRRFGVSTWPGMDKRELHQPVVGSLSHTLILGPSGTGKSNLLAGLLLDDVAAGRGVLLIDMKGDTAVDALERVPEARQDDVVIVDPADERAVPGLKGLVGGSPELMADLWVGLFRNLFADSWGDSHRALPAAGSADARA